MRSTSTFLKNECGKNVFPDNPEWGVYCNIRKGHTGVCARFDVPARG